eukprot:gnl/TRDRNA2_/TRDRNA2_127718_c0_seq1.p1 gnl/TRDRNA2_/TRDRNA2_127718_c0~~gnl/TRDRNA2_/TRDRNA2_127718_c0_seq1.p1  ORF type:complete len:115 (+),score=22.76 gnl/TRDRNA2_/TRDRNA2_127718_c0_seq1:171-515(+)
MFTFIAGTAFLMYTMEMENLFIKSLVPQFALSVDDLLFQFLLSEKKQKQVKGTTVHVMMDSYFFRKDDRWPKVLKFLCVVMRAFFGIWIVDGGDHLLWQNAMFGLHNACFRYVH